MSTPLPDHIDFQEVKRKLPLAYVAHRLGIALNEHGTGPCPFHDDKSRDSFGLWLTDDGIERWHCFPCNLGGDVFDLIGRKEGLAFGDQVTRAAELLAEIPSDFKVPSLSSPSEGPADWAPWVQKARDRAATPEWRGRLSAWAGLADPLDPEACEDFDTFLRDTLGWGCDDFGAAVIPHWNAASQLTGCKIREPSGRRGSKLGSKYDALYGAWRGNPHRQVLLTEGETDMAWAAYHAARGGLKLDVHSLPRGAGSPPSPEQLAFLSGVKCVYLALDPDTAGIRATRAWVDALATVGIPVRICRLPFNRDLRDAQPDLAALIASAAIPYPEPDTISVAPGGYVMVDSKGNPYSITNWTLEPLAALTAGDDGPGYQVTVTTAGISRPDVIRLGDFNTVFGMRKWASQRGLQFAGRDSEAQAIFTHLQWRGCVCPEIFQTDRVGLHEPPPSYSFAGPSYVWPGGYHGKLPFLYVPGTKKANLTTGHEVLIDSHGRFDWQWLEDFFLLSDPSVTHTLVAWIVAAARRPEVRDFPMLFLGGPSGTGKSTLAKLSLRLAGSAVEAPLGGITPYVLMQRLAATTSIPIFVDEFTRLSRKDTREALQGLIPTIYEGGTAERGQADLVSLHYRLTAPTMIAGEDSLNLDRELDRIISVTPRKNWQNYDALTKVQGVPLERFGFMLNWFLTSGAKLPPLVPPTPSSNRKLHNREVILGGWKTLHALLDAAAERGDTVPSLPLLPADPREVEGAADEEMNVYEEVVRECAPLRDMAGLPVVWADPAGRGTWVRFTALLPVAERALDQTLPGRSRACREYFRTKYKVSAGKPVPPGMMEQIRADLIEGFLLNDDGAGLQ